MKLVAPNPSFDQILWDERRHVLSFRRAGIGDYVNMWLNSDVDEAEGFDHHVERNGSAAANSVVLWTDGEWDTKTKKFHITLPSYRAGEFYEQAREGDGPAVGAP